LHQLTTILDLEQGGVPTSYRGGGCGGEMSAPAAGSARQMADMSSEWQSSVTVS